MFTNISWGNYSIAIGASVLVWYSFIGFRFYYQELKQIAAGKQPIKFPFLRKKGAGQSHSLISDNTHAKSSESPLFTAPFSVQDDAEKLIDILIQAILESDERNLSKDAFRNYLMLILNDYQYVKNSSFRPMINERMVSESEKFPQLILTFAEVDGLWDEAI